MVRTVNLGMPRIGPRRETKWATERYWSGTVGADELEEVARARRAENWRLQIASGIDELPTNDFSLYDQVLDMSWMLGALPERFHSERNRGLEGYFALARGSSGPTGDRPPLEMTKWFDTNYHYLVPELSPHTEFLPDTERLVREYVEAAVLGVSARPVLLGPVTYLLLSKPTVAGFSLLELLPRLLTAYREVLGALSRAGASWVQLDEPCLVTDLSSAQSSAFEHAYDDLSGGNGPQMLLATYFGGLGDNLRLATHLPVDGLHVDLARAPEQLEAVVEQLASHAVLSAGVVDGRNVWRNDLRRSLSLLEKVAPQLGDRLWVGPSCSLLHVPLDAAVETQLDAELLGWLSFGCQKLAEVRALARALNEGEAAIADELAASDEAVGSRLSSPRIVSTKVRERLATTTALDLQRRSPYADRRAAQTLAVPLPPLPTTTIGSFPQTNEIRRARRMYLEGELSEGRYREFCEHEIDDAIAAQEAIGLDVLVHGEAERNDMVQYFGEQLDGFAITDQGWVQSYGTRCVRPPILFGDVARPRSMTVDWARHAQSRTVLPVKGMLTGPVTILNWSFVRGDQPLEDTSRQLALAIRDEVLDLEAAGIRIIQVDEPALREGLPLRVAERSHYLSWAVDCFRLATAGVEDQTQIHTHMCYAEFGDVLGAVADLDADVISLEAARSAMGLLGELSSAQFTAGIGPGVYDIHSSQVPSESDIAALVERILRVLSPEQVWINPDCGLKTRRWEEVTPALSNMVEAARALRHKLAEGALPVGKRTA